MAPKKRRSRTPESNHLSIVTRWFQLHAGGPGGVRAAHGIIIAVAGTIAAIAKLLW